MVLMYSGVYVCVCPHELPMSGSGHAVHAGGAVPAR